MNLARVMHISGGATAVIGSGGKTTLLSALAGNLSGTVILTTSTHILPFPNLPLASNEAQVKALIGANHIVCVGAPVANGKLAEPACGIPTLAPLADHVLVEADGSHHLPLKAHAEWEPVVPASTNQTILVVGASGFGQPVKKAVHRPELFCKRTGCLPTDPAGPRLVARELAAEVGEGRIAFDRLLVNQVDDEHALADATALAHELARLGICQPVVAASLRSGWAQQL